MLLLGRQEGSQPDSQSHRRDSSTCLHGDNKNSGSRGREGGGERQRAIERTNLRLHSFRVVSDS